MSQQSSSTNRLYLTNDYSIVSKYSAVKNGYFNDRLLEKLVEVTQDVSKSWNRTPLVNRGYAARLMAVDWMLQRSLQYESIDCCIILGAGYDTLAFRYIENCAWIEVDLPQVVDNKYKFIVEHNIFGQQNSFNNDAGVLTSTSFNYSLIACDIRETSKFERMLKVALNRAGKYRRVAIINEVCLCYLDVNDVKRAIRSIVENVKDISHRIYYVGLEQVRPDDTGSQFSNVMLNHFNSLGYPLKHYPTGGELRELFCDHLDFTHLTVVPMYQIYHNILMTAKLNTEAFKREPFDEFEALDMMLSHYSIVTAVMILRDVDMEKNPSFSEQLIKLSENLQDISLNRSSSSLNTLQNPFPRYGHSSCALITDPSEFSVMIVGGFGKSGHSDDTSHRRLGDCIVLRVFHDKSTVESDELKVDDIVADGLSLERMYCQIRPIDKNLVFVNGGRKSPTSKGASLESFVAKQASHSKLELEHKFSLDQSTGRWRHKLSPMLHNGRFYQIGGFSGSPGSSPVVVWDLDSSRLGPTQCTQSYLSDLDRHSFGMDFRDQSTALIFGGLQTPIQVRDTPVDSDGSVIIWDTRESCLSKLEFGDSSRCYGGDVHFINEHQFIRIGGLSCSTGLNCNSIDTFDLRNGSCITRMQLPDTEDCPILLNNTTEHQTSKKMLMSIGGGANYFTFGTKFNSHYLFYLYSDNE